MCLKGRAINAWNYEESILRKDTVVAMFPISTAIFAFDGG